MFGPKAPIISKLMHFQACSLSAQSVDGVLLMALLCPREQLASEELYIKLGSVSFSE